MVSEKKGHSFYPVTDFSKAGDIRDPAVPKYVFLAISFTWRTLSKVIPTSWQLLNNFILMAKLCGSCSIMTWELSDQGLEKHFVGDFSQKVKEEWGVAQTAEVLRLRLLLYDLESQGWGVT